MKKMTTLIVLALTGIVSVNTYAQGFGGGMGSAQAVLAVPAWDREPLPLLPESSMDPA